MKVITRLKNTNKFRIVAKKTAGLVLTGAEIKAVRNHQISISDAYILPHKNELYLYKVSISSYRCSDLFSQKTISQQKSRKLLLKRSEINSLIVQMKTKSYNLIPLQIFINERGWAKTEIALTQTLKKFQVKALVKEKEIKKKLQRKEYS
jgi:SsrA-binding protein